MTEYTYQSLLGGKQHIHFIGIGGSGMFPLVQILHAKGFFITGSDNNHTDTTALEEQMGIRIFYEHSPSNIEGADLVVHTAAIMADNVELIAAKASPATVVERSVLLGVLSECYQNAICVSGTHGKTTTSGMIAQVLLESGLDPTCVIGGKVKAVGGNGRAGETQNMVCEACEFVDTFLKLSPDVSVILNIDGDHMDYFKTMDNLIASFKKFAQKTSRLLIVNGDDANTLQAVQGVEKPTLTFGFGEHNDYYAQNIQPLSGVQTAFDLMHKGQKLTTLTISVPGRHNILNALAAAAACLDAGVSPQQLAESLKHFHGAGRRFEILYNQNGITVADDYAHHPAEISATLDAAKQLQFKRIIAVFQPFTFSRTYMLLEDFAKALQVADVTLLSKIMGSREKNTYNIYAEDLQKLISGCIYHPEFEQLAEEVANMAQPGDLIITLGCGDIYKCARMVVQKLQKQ